MPSIDVVASIAQEGADAMQSQEILGSLFLFLEDPNAPERAEYRRSIIQRLENDLKGREWLNHARQNTKENQVECSDITEDIYVSLNAAGKTPAGTGIYPPELNIAKGSETLPQERIKTRQRVSNGTPHGRIMRWKIARWVQKPILSKKRQSNKALSGLQVKRIQGQAKHEHFRRETRLKV